MESSAVTMRRPCFIEDDGLITSFPQVEAGFSGYNKKNYTQNLQINPPFSCHNGAAMMMRRNSLRNISSTSPASVSSPRSGRFYDARFEDTHLPHFLQACFLCKNPLGGNRDIFMYRGDTPFCSEECRQEQIEIDEAKERKFNSKALRSKKDSSSSSSSSSSPSSSSSNPAKNQSYRFRTGTAVAA